MFAFIKRQKGKFLYPALLRLNVFILSFSLIFSPSAAHAQSILNLPIPGAMVSPSPAFMPVLLKGMTIHPDDPLKFNFIVDSGQVGLDVDEVRKESKRLVKYFLASMTVPNDDLWVNLSPYEEERIIPEELGKTELGRDLLAQDYLLKQLTASLMYPEKELGKKFWDKVYKQAEEQFGTSQIPVDTFNKVWIIPETASVYEHEQTVYITDAYLKVMLDSDYEARQTSTSSSDASISKQIINDIIIPEIELEVNTGKHFAPLRQIYHSLILSKWYKETIKDSLLSQVYVDQNKIKGVESEDPDIKDKIYDQYMQAYKKGVFNYIKEDYDNLSQTMIPRKYFSGGELFDQIPLETEKRFHHVQDIYADGYNLSVKVRPARSASSPIKGKDENENPRIKVTEKLRNRIEKGMIKTYGGVTSQSITLLAKATESDRTNLLNLLEGLTRHVKLTTLIKITDALDINMKELSSSPVSGEQIVEEFRRQDYFRLLDLPMFQGVSIYPQDTKNLEKAILRITELGNENDPLSVSEVRDVVIRALDIFDQRKGDVNLAPIIGFEVLLGIALEKKAEKEAGVFSEYPEYFTGYGLPPAFANWMRFKMAAGRPSVEEIIDLARSDQASSPVMNINDINSVIDAIYSSFTESQREKLFKKTTVELFQTAAKTFIDEFDIDVTKDNQYKKLMNVVRLLLERGNDKWLKAKQVIHFLKEEAGFNLKDQPWGRKSKLLTIVYGIGRGRATLFDDFKNDLTEIQDIFQINQIQLLDDTEKQKILTAVYYIAAAKADPKKKLKSGMEYFKDTLTIISGTFWFSSNRL